MSRENEKIVISKDGATSSACPDFSLIPLDALIALAERYSLGVQKHGKDNWRKGLTDKDYVIQRLNHGIYHALKMINKLEGKIENDGDDDAGAIMWCGAFASEAAKIHLKKEDNV